MRSLKTVVNDLSLRDAVADELAWDPKIDDSRIRVAARDGAISLSGAVTSYPQKWAAVRAAEGDREPHRGRHFQCRGLVGAGTDERAFRPELSQLPQCAL